MEPSALHSTAEESRLQRESNAMSSSGYPYSRDVTQRLNAFTLFAKLPFELREEIWKMASNNPNIVEGRYDYRTGVWRSANNPPSVLYTCHESRKVGLKAYKLAFHTFHTTPYNKRVPHLWFNDNHDMLYINRRTFFSHLSVLPPSNSPKSST
jgi:hypothetical protein